MITGRVRTLANALLFGLAFTVLMSANGHSQQPQKGPTDSAPAESMNKAPAPGVHPGLEPKAIEVLKAASRRLAAARTMRFRAVVSYENPSRLGPPLIYTTRSEVTLQRPDKLRVITPGDGPASEFYYDGKTIMAFAPAANLVAVAKAPPTIDAALEEAYHFAAIYFPFTDIVVTDPYKHVADGLTLAFYIGQSRVIGGTMTDMVAYETHGVFVQIWVGTKDKLPRMSRAVFRSDPLQLRHQAEFSNWQLDGIIPASSFASSRAKSAKRIPFDRPDALIPRGINPPAGSAPAEGEPAKNK